jgi:Zn-dependent peptidase ImmA (M78 family)/transcriptional regulator with XRE-family HTH domain
MEILLQTDVLRWARQRAGLSIDALAEKLSAGPDKVRSWEENGRITMAQAERLAKAARIPLGYLYFPTPPKEDLPVQDFRTLEAAPVESPSPELLDILYDALRKQEWYRDHLLSEGADPLPFIGSFSGSENPLSAANHIRQTLGVTSGVKVSGLPADVLRHQVAHIEARGVLVLRSGIVGNNTHRPLNVEEFRGFALSDPYAPLIFINAKDSQSAQIFTLMHELVHLWLGESGVSNPLASSAAPAGIERFCNMVAAELLVPKVEFQQQWKEVARSNDPFGLLASHFKVSVLVILRRAQDLGVLNEAKFRRLYKEAEESFRTVAPKASKGGDFHATQFTRHSRTFIRALVTSTLEGRTPYRDALNLVGMSKIQTFKDLATKVIKAT